MISKKILKLVSVLAVLGIIAPSFSSAVIPARISEAERNRFFDSVIKELSGWQFYKEFDFTSSNTATIGSLIKIILDQEVLNNSKEDLGDLRLYVLGKEVPYKFIVERGAFSQENIYPVRILNNSFSSDGQYNVFIVDFGQSGFLNSSLNIFTSSENFKRVVEILGSNDMASWNALKSNGYIYDYTDRVGNFKAQNTSLNYPENAFRYIQVKIFSGGEVPLAINSAQVSKITKKESKETIFNPKYEVKENSAKRITEVIVDLEKKGWPTSNITLVSPNENFNREAVVYESGDKTNWQSVGQSYIFNYNTPKFVGANLEVGYSETKERYLKIEIFNRNDRPISIVGLSAKTILRSIVFQYDAYNIEDYRLYYGNPKANFPEYDLEKFFPYLDTGVYFGATLSEERINPFYQKEIPPELPITERIPYLVPCALVLAIAMMGFMVFRFIKKVGVGK